MESDVGGAGDMTVEGMSSMDDSKANDSTENMVDIGKPVDFGVYGKFYFGSVFQIPASTLQILIESSPETAEAQNSENIVYVYKLNCDDGTGESNKFPLELQLYQDDSYVTILASYTTTGMNAKLKHRVQKLIYPILRVSLVDEEGQIIEEEKWSHGISDYFGTMDFEIENFLSNASIAELLTKATSLKMRISLTGYWIDFPKDPNFKKDEEDECKLDRGDHECIGEMESSNNAKIDSSFVANFPQLMEENQHSSFFLNEARSGKFADTSVTFKDGDRTILLSAHRVFLIAHSPMLKAWFEIHSELVIEGFDMTAASVDAFQEFLYTAEVSSRDFQVLETLGKLAGEYKIAGLKDRCIRQVFVTLNELNSEQYLDYYRLSVQFSSTDLLKMAIDIFERNRNTINRSKSSEDFNNSKPNSEIEQDLEELSLSVDYEQRNKTEIQSKEDAKQIGAIIELSFGTIVKIPASICNKLFLKPEAISEDIADDLIVFEFELPVEQSDESSEILNLQIYKTKNSSSLHLKSNPTLGLPAVLPGLTISIYNSNRRIVHESYTQAIPNESGKDSIQIQDLITEELFQTNKLSDEKNEITIRVSYGKNILQVQIQTEEDSENNSENMKSRNEFGNLLESDSIRSRIRPQLGNGAFSDALIRVLEFHRGSILLMLPVHRLILGAFSKIWEEHLENSFAITISTVSYEEAVVIQKLLDYIYGGHLNTVTGDDACELGRAATELQICGPEIEIRNRLISIK